MSKRLLTISALAGVLLFAIFAILHSNNPALAKSQPKPPTATERMAKYEAPQKKKNASDHVRVSKVKQLNIVAEAANVLNVLPIDIINEMKKGKTLVQVAKDKGLAESEFNKKLADFDAKTVDTAVKNGVITKEHGDAIAAGRADRIKKGMQEKAMDVNKHMAMDMGN
jgi:hypothetical protein